ncbi:MAG: hypothetical protein BroJett003_13070 [Planctomycetota bacterium]|nr:MAG: hypothetical protein BroJett003_13070 [Planctomycetota bacterium]
MFRAGPFLTGVVVASLASAAEDARAQSARYDCRIDDRRSGLDADISLHANTSGTLIGNWNEFENPSGTRTKPGFFGGFGERENLPVDVSFDFALGGPSRSASAGAFRLRINPRRERVRLSRLEADLLADGPLILPAELTLETDTFRTRSPDSLFPGDVPITLPLGEIALTELRLVQTEDAAVGTLSRIEGDRYAFEVILIVQVGGRVTVLENDFELPPTPVPLPLTGEVVAGPLFARVISVQPIDLSQAQNPELELPEFPLDLPTILPPGQTAHLLMNLVLQEIGATFQGELRLEAEGVRQGP